jgi:hypothetical protein
MCVCVCVCVCVYVCVCVCVQPTARFDLRPRKEDAFLVEERIAQVHRVVFEVFHQLNQGRTSTQISVVYQLGFVELPVTVPVELRTQVEREEVSVNTWMSWGSARESTGERNGSGPTRA